MNTAGALASMLDETASRGDTESCAALLERLEAMAVELMGDTRGLTIGMLRA